MVNRVISEILNEIEHGAALEEALHQVLGRYKIEEITSEIRTIDKTWQKELSEFLTRKMVAGRSEGTIKLYKLHLSRMLLYINKPIKDITESDLFMYISTYKKTRKVSNVYLENIRLSFSTFFRWLSNKGYIPKNPVSGLEPIKKEKRIKRPFTEIEMEKIRMACTLNRDRAIVEFLYSTGVRVSEMTALDIADLDFANMELIVRGKGNKERTVYLTPVSCIHIKKYLDERKDKNTALFVGRKIPNNRLKKSGVESTLKKIGARAKVENVHPHRFRRTMATNMLRKGMPVEEVMEILGHSKLDTTMIYCQVNKENTKHSHKKYI